MFDLNGKVVLITGATGGIGKSIARKMREKGAKLILSGTRQDVLNNIVSEFGNEAKGIVTNLNDKDELEYVINTNIIYCLDKSDLNGIFSFSIG